MTTPSLNFFRIQNCRDRARIRRSPGGGPVWESRPVLGFDINAARVEELREGVDRTMECSHEDLLTASQLQFTCNESDLDPCGVFIVTVPTPVGIT